MLNGKLYESRLGAGRNPLLKQLVVFCDIFNIKATGSRSDPNAAIVHIKEDWWRRGEFLVHEGGYKIGRLRAIISFCSGYAFAVSIILFPFLVLYSLSFLGKISIIVQLICFHLLLIYFWR